MGETIADSAVPVELNITQFIAAIVCHISEVPETYRALTQKYGVKRSTLNSSSEQLQRCKLIRYHERGWVAGQQYMVRLRANQQGPYRLKDGEAVQILQQVFGPDRRFVIGKTYDLRELVAEARRYAQSVATTAT